MPPDDSILILASVTALAVTTGVAEVAHGSFSMRPILSAGVVGLFLSAIDFVAPQVARAFCWLVILVAFLRNGTATLNALSGTTGKANHA